MNSIMMHMYNYIYTVPLWLERENIMITNQIQTECVSHRNVSLSNKHARDIESYLFLKIIDYFKSRFQNKILEYWHEEGSNIHPKYAYVMFVYIHWNWIKII